MVFIHCSFATQILNRYKSEQKVSWAINFICTQNPLQSEWKKEIDGNRGQKSENKCKNKLNSCYERPNLFDGVHCLSLKVWKVVKETFWEGEIATIQLLFSKEKNCKKLFKWGQWMFMRCLEKILFTHFHVYVVTFEVNELV